MAAGDCDSDPSKVERIVSKFFSKCIHVILQSRYMTNNANSDDVVVVTSTVDKWFNLNLRDFIPSELIRVAGVSSSVQLVVDLVLLNREYLHSRATLAPPPSYGRDQEGRVIERWVMMFEGNNKRVDAGRFKLNIFYKKCVLMLRSICVMVKLLPAYKLFKDLTASSSKPSEFSIGHHISSFVEPFTREEEAKMQKYLFNPVETSCGRLCLSVLYLSSPGDLTGEVSYHLLPHLVIPDYCRRLLVERPVCKAPNLHTNGTVVTYGKPSLLTTEKLTATPSNAAQRSASLDHLRCEAHDFLDPEELRDPFQPKLSDNAVIGSMFSIFSAAAPLCRNLAFTPNKPDPQAESVNVRVPTNGTVKTTSDALQELQNHIELKKSILQRTSNIVSLSAVSRVSAGQDSTPSSK